MTLPTLEAGETTSAPRDARSSASGASARAVRAEPTPATPIHVLRLLDPDLPNELLGTIFAYWKERV